jgi:hypothetical protein
VREVAIEITDRRPVGIGESSIGSASGLLQRLPNLGVCSYVGARQGRDLKVCDATDILRMRFQELLVRGEALPLALYGGESVDPTLREWTIDEAIRSRLPASPVEGDAVDIAGLRFTVRTTRGARIIRAGIGLPRAR